MLIFYTFVFQKVLLKMHLRVTFIGCNVICGGKNDEIYVYLMFCMQICPIFAVLILVV